MFGNEKLKQEIRTLKGQVGKYQSKSDKFENERRNFQSKVDKLNSRLSAIEKYLKIEFVNTPATSEYKKIKKGDTK